MCINCTVSSTVQLDCTAVSGQREGNSMVENGLGAAREMTSPKQSLAEPKSKMNTQEDEHVVWQEGGYLHLRGGDKWSITIYQSLKLRGKRRKRLHTLSTNSRGQMGRKKMLK